MKTALLLTLLASAAWAQQPCDQLKNLALPNTRITAATSVPPGAFTLSVTSYFDERNGAWHGVVGGSQDD